MEEGPALGQVPAAAGAEHLQLLPGGHQAAGGQHHLLPAQPGAEQVSAGQTMHEGLMERFTKVLRLEHLGGVQIISSPCIMSLEDS